MAGIPAADLEKQAAQMKSTATHVYCFQLGDTNCFKIGHSIEPDDRKSVFKTASPVELIERRREPSPHAEALEKYIHYLLEPRRVKHRDELFDATMEEVNEAFEQAIPICQRDTKASRRSGCAWQKGADERRNARRVSGSVGTL
jgi:hypothetical protein